MKDSKGPHKSHRKGNSQFIRDKLDEQYNPKVRYFKSNFMSYQQIPKKDKHQFRAREEHELCDKAIDQLKKGSNLILDWNTRSNFRVTKTKLPKLKTEPDWPSGSGRQLSPIASHNTSSTHLTPVQQKRIHLARLLYQKQKKKYMQSKHEMQQQKALFFQDEVSRIENKSPNLRNIRSGHSSKERSLRQQPRIQEVQDQLINNSKLRILKQELKNKFIQIREFYYKSAMKDKRKFLLKHQQ